MSEDVNTHAFLKSIGDSIDRVEWRLMYGEFGGLFSIKLALWIIVLLLGVIAYNLIGVCNYAS